MHVLVVSISRATAPTGVCRHAANLCLALSRSTAGVQVTLLVGAWQEQYFRDSLSLADAGIDIVRADIPNTSLRRNLFDLFGVRALVRRLQPDIVHFAFPVPIWLPVNNGAKTVVSLHDLYALEAPDSFGERRAWANRLTTLWGLRAADAIAVVSQTTLKSLQANYPALTAKCSVVPNLVLQAKEHEAAAGTKGAGNYLLCVAQRRAHKRLDLLLEAFAKLRRRRGPAEDTQLVMVGEHGPETASLLAKAQALLPEGTVLWRRGLTDAELTGLYRGALALVAPSRIEGFGLPVAEALALGCRVVCSRIAAHEEVAGDEATYFSVDADSGAVADAIERCLARQDAAPQRIPPCLEEPAEQYLALYASLSAGEKSPDTGRQDLAGGAHERAVR